jgi:uncharacterized protein (DUF2147 family)
LTRWRQWRRWRKRPGVKPGPTNACCVQFLLVLHGHSRDYIGQMRANLVSFKASLAIAGLLALVVLGLNACNPASMLAPRPHGIEGKWRSADGGYVVEFLPTGSCSAKMRMQGREVGGPCTYTVQDDKILLHYQGMGSNTQNSTATWNYKLDGDNLNVSVFGNSLALRRVR